MIIITIHYEQTNNHDYLRYDSHHPDHIKRNIPYTLAKRIIVFCTQESTLNRRLEELKTWLLQCGYPFNIIQKSFHNAMLQGPAPAPKPKSNTLPFVTTYYSNINSQNTVSLCNDLLQNSRNDRVDFVFNDCNVVMALKQPPNLLRLLTNSKFISSPLSPKENGLFKCSDKRCKLCRLYIQECDSFMTSKGIKWNIKSHITCNSDNILYYLTCVTCNDDTTYTGKTVNLRDRMNNHITGCRWGNSTDKFDNHVYRCLKEQKKSSEPYFKIFTFLEVSHPKYLIPYETYLHSKKYDTMN